MSCVAGVACRQSFVSCQFRQSVNQSERSARPAPLRYAGIFVCQRDYLSRREKVENLERFPFVWKNQLFRWESKWNGLFHWKFFGKKGIPSEVFLFSRFYRNDRKIAVPFAATHKCHSKTWRLSCFSAQRAVFSLLMRTLLLVIAVTVQQVELSLNAPGSIIYLMCFSRAKFRAKVNRSERVFFVLSHLLCSHL